MGNLATIKLSKHYNRKTHFKTVVILECLKVDISVFFVDIDSVFMKNPVPILKQYSNIDFATQQEHDSNGTTHVSGLMLVHATPKSIQIFEETAKQQKGQKLKPDQDILNSVIQHHVSNLTIREFEQSNFSDGRTYFLE